MQRGFSLIEILIVITIITILAAMSMAGFASFNRHRALEQDVDGVVETLRHARGLTLASKNASQYGVHFGSTTITLFTGAAYSASDPGNQSFDLRGTDTVVSLNLTGGGSDVIFNRLTGETNQSGTVVISSASLSLSKTVTIYQTGVVQKSN